MGRGGTEAPSCGRGCTKLHPHHTHKQARSTPGRQDHREAEHYGVKGRKATVSSQTGSRPLLCPSCSIPKVSRAPPALLGHSPMATSFFPATGDEKKKGTEQGGAHPSCWVVCPPPSVVRAQGRLLAGHSLVEVDVAQVLGRLLRGTHFLVIVDHPSGEGGGGKRMNNPGILNSVSLTWPLELTLVTLGQRLPTFSAWVPKPTVQLPPVSRERPNLTGSFLLYSVSSDPVVSLQPPAPIPFR